MIKALTPGTVHLARPTPIRFMRRDGSVHVRPELLTDTPVILVAVPHTLTDMGEGTIHADWSGPGHEWRKTWALVDTGADHTYADEEIAARGGWPVLGAAPVSSATHTVNRPYYKATFMLVESSTLLDAEVLTVPLVANNRRYTVVIGMSVLAQGRLVMDFSHGEHHFTGRKGA